MTVYLYLGGPYSLLSQKCFLSTKVDKSTGVASVYPSYSDNIHLLPFLIEMLQNNCLGWVHKSGPQD